MHDFLLADDVHLVKGSSNNPTAGLWCPVRCEKQSRDKWSYSSGRMAQTDVRMTCNIPRKLVSECDALRAFPGPNIHFFHTKSGWCLDAQYDPFPLFLLQPLHLLRMGTDTIQSPPQVNFEAINEAGARNKYMVLYHMKLKGQEEPMVVCDLLTLDDDGLISRVDNCFDTSKVPQPIADMGAPTLGAKEDS